MFPWRIYKVAGNSMTPTLRSGQYVLAKQSGQIKSGDIIVCRYDGQLMIKRVKQITPQGFMVQGDNEAGSLDSRTVGVIYQENILAKVVCY